MDFIIEGVGVFIRQVGCFVFSFPFFRIHGTGISTLIIYPIKKSNHLGIQSSRMHPMELIRNTHTHMPSPKLTASLHLKMDGKGRLVSFPFEMVPFQVLC